MVLVASKSGGNIALRTRIERLFLEVGRYVLHDTGGMSTWQVDIPPVS